MTIVICGVILLLIAEFPFLFTEDWTWTDLTVVTLFNLILSFVLWYWWLFGGTKTVRMILIFHVILLLIMHPFLIGIHHWEVVGGSGQIFDLPCCVEFVNVNFGILVLLASATAAYAIAYTKSDAASLSAYSSVEWTLFTIHLKNRTFGSMKNLPFIHEVYWPLCALGLVYLLWFMDRYAHDPNVIPNAKIIGLVQLMAMVIVYRVGLVVGECLRLMQIERQLSSGKFLLENVEGFLKWRHDYVKHHLPGPIRRLNLRVFNRHVDAYERLQESQKRKASQ